GFVYIRNKNNFKALIVGGEQEKGLRAGTEAPHQVVGMAKAVELAYQDLDEHRKHISELKAYCKAQLSKHFPEIKYNGDDNTFYNVVNVSLPFSPEKAAILLFQLVIKGIAVSLGCDCNEESN